MTTLVDTNVLLDVVTEDPQWVDWSMGALHDAFSHGPILINPIIYAEFSTHIETKAEVDDFLSEDSFGREAVPFAAAFLAAKSYRVYRKRGGKKRSPLPDFFIGAHAAVRGYQILTRDTRRFATYFADVPLVSPPTEST